MFRINLLGKLPKTFNLYLLGDQQIGNVGTSFPKIAKSVEIIEKDRNAIWGAMGDQAECIYIGDKRYKKEIHDGKYSTANAQAMTFVDLYKSISKKCIFYLDGNHEEKIEDIFRFDNVVSDEWNKNRVTPLAHGGRTVKATLTPHFRLFATHGSGSVRSRALNPQLREVHEELMVQKKLALLQGDCHVMAMAHVHKLRICKPTNELAIVGVNESQQIYSESLEGNHGYVPIEHRWYCMTGAFMRGWIDGATSYIEKGMYAPTELGMIRIRVKSECVDNVEKVII